MPTNVRDPRTIITPDAFEIDGALLGLPLAPPWRRFWAMMVDLTLVGLLTAVLSDVQLLLWTVIGVGLVRAALRRSGRTMSQAAGLLLRVAVGCLGVTILAAVVGVFAFFRFSGDDEGPVTVPAGVERAVAEGLTRGAQDTGPGVRRPLDAAALEITSESLNGVRDPAGAVRAMVDMLEELEALPFPRSMKRRILVAATPEDAPWAPLADSLARVALDRWEAGGGRRGRGGGAADGAADGTGGAGAAVAETGGEPGGGDAEGAAVSVVSALSAEAVVREFAAAVEAGTDRDDARYRALRARMITLVAADTLGTLGDRVEDLDEALAGEREARADLEEEAEENRSGTVAVAGLLRDVWDQLGSAIGLWSVYFTVMLTLWRGQTVGKRLMGVRVLRLDGADMTWWPAFERAGGYVAGLATGLLGFAQVFWDANRQCIHDKIVGTVVVDDRAERVPGAWQEAWSEAGPPPPSGSRP